MKNTFNFNPIITKGDYSVRIVHIILDVSPSTSGVHKESIRKLKRILAEIKATAKSEGFDIYIAITEYSSNVYPVIDFCDLSCLDINRIPFSKDVKNEYTNTGAALIYAKNKTMDYYNSIKRKDTRMVRTPMIFLISDGQVFPRTTETLEKYSQAATELKALEHPGNRLDELVTVVGAMVNKGDLSEFHQLTNYPERIVHLESKNIQPFLEVMHYYTCTKTNSAFSNPNMLNNICNYV